MAGRFNSIFRVAGAWTKAGVASCIHVKSPQHPEGILLDCGILQSQTYAADIVLVTHGHVDHAGCCIHHARGRALTSAPATYYIPKSIEAPLLKAKSAFEEMDGKEIPMNIVPVAPNDSVMLSKNLKAVVFETEHRVASQGYALYSINKGSILPEYQHLSHKEISKLAKEGKSFLSDPIERLELVYTGDTTFAGLLKPQNAFIFTSPLMITELTYLDGDYEKAMQWNHIHIQDIINYQDLFESVGKIVFVHISQKYSFNRAVELMRTQLPLGILGKSAAALASFDSREILTDLQDNLLRAENAFSSSSAASSSSSAAAPSSSSQSSRWREAQKLPGWGWTKKHYSNTNSNTGSNNKESAPNRQSRQYSTHPYSTYQKKNQRLYPQSKRMDVGMTARRVVRTSAEENYNNTRQQYAESFSIHSQINSSAHADNPSHSHQ